MRAPIAAFTAARSVVRRYLTNFPVKKSSGWLEKLARLEFKI